MRCNIKGCKEMGTQQPILVFPVVNGKPGETMRVELGFLVCPVHAASIGPDTYTSFPGLWNTVEKFLRVNGMEIPDRRDANLVFAEAAEKVPVIVTPDSEFFDMYGEGLDEQ